MNNEQVIERIAKLLAKAERATTAAEAQAYFDKAQSLATAHSISLAKARLVTGEVKVTPINKRIVIGEPRKHANRHLINLMYAVATTNDLQMDIARNSTFCILFGFPSDIATTEMLWSRISTQMVRLGEDFLTSGTWRGDVRVIRQGRRTRTAPITKQSARAQYYESFIETVQERLQHSRDKEIHRQKVHEASQETTASPGTEVALLQKATAVTDYYSEQSDARGSWRGDSRVQGLSRSAREAGTRDGHRVRLSGETGVTGSRAEIGQ